MKKLSVAVIIILACACPAFSYTLNQHELELVYSGFGPDPKFGQIKAVEVDSNILICGYVNAKNKFGQYIGETLFVGSLLGKGNNAVSFFVLGDGINPIGQKANEIFCRKNGITFSSF